MKQLIFPAQEYTLDSKIGFKYEKSETSFVGVIELLWAGVNNAVIQGLSRKEHSSIKTLKQKIREISIFKDSDKDSRVALPGVQQLLLEAAEYEILNKLISANHFQSMISEDTDLLWSIIESAQDYIPPKPSLVKD